MLSSTDSLNRRARRLRWPVMAKRCASSRIALDQAQRRGLRRQHPRQLLPLDEQPLLAGSPVRPLGDADQRQILEAQFGQRVVNGGDLARAAVDQQQIGPDLLAIADAGVAPLQGLVQGRVVIARA